MRLRGLRDDAPADDAAGAVIEHGRLPRCGGADRFVKYDFKQIRPEQPDAGALSGVAVTDLDGAWELLSGR